MKQVLTWTNGFLSELLEKFEYKMNALSSDNIVNVEDIASKRFLFYSLEKEITLQSYVLQKEYVQYESLAAWEKDNQNGVLIKNDEDGEGIYFYLIENSEVHQWIVDTLKDFSLDEVPFQAK